MLKYVNTEIVFMEIPDETTLAINISNCPHNCEGCHSPYLRDDIGKILNENEIIKLLLDNKGITTICFMGGDSDPKEINNLASIIRSMEGYKEPGCWCDVKIAWYSGSESIPFKLINIRNFDYIKIGSYKKELGPLNKESTNQTLYKINHCEDDSFLDNITRKLWKNDNF